MRSKMKHLRIEIPYVRAERIIDFGPIIDPPFVDGVFREAPDSTIELKDVEYSVLPDRPEGEAARQARQTAQSDPRVIDLLGRRSEFIGVGIVDQKKGDPELQVVWYAYDSDQTIEAITDNQGIRVCNVRVAFSQPALTTGEQARANELVAASGRLPGVRDGRCLLIEETDRGSPRYGLRLVDLCFNPDITRLPRWWALVDLSTDELVDAGDVPQKHEFEASMEVKQ